MKVLASYINSERELITIEEADREPFAGQRVLCIYDDYPSPVKAVHLLDEGTVEWLRRQLK